MSNFTNLNEVFHIFSKTPVADGQTLASARNKSGHTVTVNDVWAEDIPAFFSAPTQTHITNLKAIAKDNDLCYDETNKSFLYFKNGEWIERANLKDGELLANFEASKAGIFNDGSLTDESKAVVKYYLNKDAIAIDGNNNNTADGNRYTARIAKGNSFVQQFISSMDKIVEGNPSSYYEPIVNGGNITEDIADKGTTTKYIANNYAGIIQFHKQMEKTSEGKLKDVTISAFEYIGTKLSDRLGEGTESLTDHTGNTNIHVTANDKSNWNSKLNQVIQGEFITVTNKNIVTVDYSTELKDDEYTLPTNKAVFDVVNPHVTDEYIHLNEDLHDTIDELVVAEEYNDFVFDISNIFFKYIHKEWIEKILILSIDTDAASPYKEYGIIVPGDIDIPYCETHYPDSDDIYLEITGTSPSDNPSTPTVIEHGFELSDAAKSAIREKVVQLARIYQNSESDFNNYVNQLKKSIPRKARWITDAKKGVCKTPLAFQGSTHRRSELVRMFFWYLDQENNKTYGAEDSYSKKYMRPGLTVKCMVAPDQIIKPNKNNMNDDEYNDRYMYHSYSYFTFIGDRNRNIPFVNWAYRPSYLTVGWQPGYGISTTHTSNGDVIPAGSYHENHVEDAFSNSGCWSYLANEQKFYCLQTAFTELKNKAETEYTEGDFITIENYTISVNTSDTISDDNTTVPTTQAVNNALKSTLLKDEVYSGVAPNTTSSDISVDNVTSKNGYGVGFMVKTICKFKSITINGITNSSNHSVQAANAKIWKNGELLTVTHSAIQPTVNEDNTKSFNLSADSFKSEIVLQPNSQYLITFHDNNSYHNYEIGYKWIYKCYPQSSSNLGIIEGTTTQLTTTIAPSITLETENNTCIFIRPEDLQDSLEQFDSNIDSKINNKVHEEWESIKSQMNRNLTFVQSEQTVGQTGIKDGTSWTHGFISKASSTGTFDTVSIYTGSAGTRLTETVQNVTTNWEDQFPNADRSDIYAIVHEQQEDGSKKEIASSSKINCSSGNTIYKFSFIPFNLIEGKTYFVEFVVKDKDTDEIYSSRPAVNLSLISDSNGLGTISSKARDSWGVQWANQYTTSTMFSLENHRLDNLTIPNDVTYYLSLIASFEDIEDSKLILLKPFITATTDIDSSSSVSQNTMTIALNKTDTSTLGEHYLGLKTMFIDKSTNSIQESLTNYTITII